MFSLLATYFLLALTVSFCCSLWEAVLLSITPTYAEVAEQQGKKIGKLLRVFKADIDRPLSAILTLNTIAHTVGAIGVGEQASVIWAESHPLITSFVVPAGMTLGILVLSEIVPKTIGATYWKELAPVTVYSLRGMIYLLYPLVWLSERITTAIKRDKTGSVFTRSEFLAMAEVGRKEGVFEPGESEIIRSLLQFKNVKVKDIMTPRTVVKSAPQDQTIADFFSRNADLRFSRIPLYATGNHDHIIGYVRKDEALAELAKQQGDMPLESLRRNIVVVEENFPIPKLFQRFFEQREHIAAAIDEFGGLAGVVTMEDVIETLIGLEIVDELDNIDDMQVLARKKWEERARRLGLLETEFASVSTKESES